MCLRISGENWNVRRSINYQLTIIMDYSETLDFLFNSLPMYQRVGKAAYKADMDNTLDLMSYLGNPERKFRSIHVAGTNGKGSVSHFTASILQQAGYKVGLYTSPHLVDFRERIRINGEMIPEQEVVRFVEENKPFFESHSLSFFEMTVGLAFDYFAREQVDVAVVEVGMGGRLDSTNVVMPDLSVITNIGFDHTQFLGDTLPKIAFEKAGIIKPKVPVVIGETHPETKPVFEARAAELEAPISFADQCYEIEPIDSDAPATLYFIVKPIANSQLPILNCQLESPLSGSYQLKNLATVMKVVELLPQFGYRISAENIRKGIADVVRTTGLHGRWELIDTNPNTICETAHNPDGINAMLEKLSTLKYHKLHIVYGCVNDKDYASILKMLPSDATFYFTQPSVPRRLDVASLVATAHGLGISGEGFANVHEAIAAARSAAQPDDLVLVTGSIFLVADALNR